MSLKARYKHVICNEIIVNMETENMLHKLVLYTLVCLYSANYSHFLSATSEKTLTIISPHRSSIKNEFLKDFENFYKKKFNQDIKVEWVDQGGASQNLRYIINKYTKKPKKTIDRLL